MTGDAERACVRARVSSFPALNLYLFIPFRYIGDLLDKRPPLGLSPADRGAERTRCLSCLEECGTGSRVNLDGASRGATSISFRVDLRGRPDVVLGVRSLTRRVRDGQGVAEKTGRMLFLS